MLKMQKNTPSGGHCQIKILFEFIVLTDNIKKGAAGWQPLMVKTEFQD